MNVKSLIIAALICLTYSRPAVAVEPNYLTRSVDGLVIPAGLLCSLIGQSLESIAVLAENDRALQVIPFQIDEMTEDGSEYILPNGPKRNSDLSDGLLSKQDEIALMVRDLGGRVKPPVLPEGAVEVEVIDPLNGSRAWCYVVALDSPAKLPATDYVTWDAQKGEIRTRLYLNGYPPAENSVYFSRVAGLPPDGGSGVDFVDRMKLRFRFEALWGLISFEGNEEMAGQQVLREKDGPVRVFRKGRVYYELPFGIQYNAGGTLQIYWESFGQGPVELKMPAGVSLVLREAMMITTTDYSPAALGMRFFSDKDPQGVIIDGKMTQKEKNQNPNGIKWNCVTGDPGTLCQRTPSTVPELPREDNHLVWIDDQAKADPPEEHPGMLGCMVGYFDLSALPPGLWRSAALFYTPPPNIDAKGIEPYLNMDMHPLVLKINGKLGRSRILPWHPGLPQDYHLNYQPLPGEIGLGHEKSK